MKQKSLSQIIAIIIGLTIINVTLFQPWCKQLPDGAKGFFVGIGIAVIAAPVIFTKLVQNRR